MYLFVLGWIADSAFMLVGVPKASLAPGDLSGEEAGVTGEGGGE